LTTVREIELAEMICCRVPSVERVRLTCSGTEANMTAVRLARGATRRAKVIRFAGCYHGHTDALLVGPGLGTSEAAASPVGSGVTEGAVADTIVVPYNDSRAFEAACDRYRGEVAAVIVEPVAANMGLVPPRPSFLDLLRCRCTADGIVLVFDEVITGFRLGPSGAQGMYGVIPDLSILGKALGGGLPLAAVGGRADLMEELAPRGGVFHAGTGAGNPAATASALAVLGELDEARYLQLEATAKALADGLRDVFAASGIPVQVPRVGTLVGLFFASEPVSDFDAARRADVGMYAACFRGMLGSGVLIPPSPMEVLFPSLAHSRADIDRTVEVASTMPLRQGTW
jgi:glutamate-1-semialdehyde 2,1-aminomutase